MHQCLILSVQLKDFFAKKKKFHRPKVRSLPWLVGLWCSCRILFFKFLDLSKLLHGFVKVATCVCQVVTSFSRPLSNKAKLKFKQMLLTKLQHLTKGGVRIIKMEY